MQFSRSPRHDRALTLIEVIFIIVVMFFVAGIMFPLLVAKKKPWRIICVNNLKENALALQVWRGDNNDHAPQDLTIAKGGARELLAAGNVAAYFQTMSNELNTPRILWCESEKQYGGINSFTNLSNNNINYFVNLDIVDHSPSTIEFGDDNLAIDGIPVKSGLNNLWTNRLVSWTEKRHVHAGNVSFADGSVARLTCSGLTNALAQLGNATNLVVIP